MPVCEFVANGSVGLMCVTTRRGGGLGGKALPMGLR